MHVWRFSGIYDIANLFKTKNTYLTTWKKMSEIVFQSYDMYCELQLFKS